MSQDLDGRLTAAWAERDRLSALAQKIQGRKEAAAKALDELRAEIVAKNLDPDSLDETIEKLEVAYEQAVAKLEQEVKAARESLTPYLEKIR
jgi:predicted  nucleic acid-binding Zn-ribbon protein